MCETYRNAAVQSYIHAHRCLILVHGVLVHGWVDGWAPSLVPVTRAMAASLWRWRCLAVAVAVTVVVAVTRRVPR